MINLFKNIWLIFTLSITSSFILIDLVILYCYSSDNLFAIKLIVLTYLFVITLCVYTSNIIFFNKKYIFFNKHIFNNIVFFLGFTFLLNFVNYIVSFFIISDFIPKYLFDIFYKKGYCLSLIFGLKEGGILSILWIQNEHIQKSNRHYQLFYFIIYLLILITSFLYHFFIKYKLIQCFASLN